MKVMIVWMNREAHVLFAHVRRHYYYFLYYFICRKPIFMFSYSVLMLLYITSYKSDDNFYIQSTRALYILEK